MSPVGRCQAMALRLTLAVGLLVPAAGAIEVWMPQTGQEAARQAAALREMSLSELRAKWAEVFGEQAPERDKQYLIERLAWRIETVGLDRPGESPEARFMHAAALIPAGQPLSGVAQLRALLSEHPDAEWAETARYLVGLGLFAAGNYSGAFEEWVAFLKRYPETPMAETVRRMLLRAAGGRTLRDLDAGAALYDRLIEQAESEEFAVRCQMAKADSMLEAGSYLRASDEYLALIDYYPESPWVTYAWYKIGVCNLMAAKWIGRGGEYLRGAEATLRDFVASFPDHVLAEQARQDLVEVRGMRAARYKSIAEYYLGPAGRPLSAMPYLGCLRDEFADTPEGEWARKKMEEVLAGEAAPLKGEFEAMSLPGVSSVREDEAGTE